MDPVPPSAALDVAGSQRLLSRVLTRATDERRCVYRAPHSAPAAQVSLVIVTSLSVTRRRLIVSPAPTLLPTHSVASTSGSLSLSLSSLSDETKGRERDRNCPPSADRCMVLHSQKVTEGKSFEKQRQLQKSQKRRGRNRAHPTTQGSDWRVPRGQIWDNLSTKMIMYCNELKP